MPAASGLKRTASKASGSGPAKIKKKNGVYLDVPMANKARGRLLTCGQGDVGQLGLGEDLMETSRFTFVSALGEKVVDACAGGMHTVALDSDGTVWTFGCNDEGALGRTTSGESDEFNPGKVELPLPAVAISAGDSHTAALLKNGDVYVWGSFRDSHGSMGLLAASEGKPRAAPALLAGECARVVSGGDHVVALRCAGTLLSLGCPEQGQLGRVPARSASRHARAGLGGLLTPTLIPLKSLSRNVWAGSHATLCLDANKPKVYAWGLNNYNQLGVTGSKKKGALYAPTEADAFVVEDDGENDDAKKAPWAWVACGQHHSLALDRAGKCFAVGRCEYGRLGLGEGSGDAERLVVVPTLAEKKCISIAAGTSTSFAVTDTGEIYAWGMGSEGQLGTGAEEDVATPHHITGKALQGRRAVKVSAGGQHTVLLVTNIEAGSDGDVPSPVSTSSTQVVTKPSTSASTPTKPKVAELGKEEVTSSTAEQMEVDEETKPPEQPVSRRRGRVSAPGIKKTPGGAAKKETKAKASIHNRDNIVIPTTNDAESMDTDTVTEQSKANEDPKEASANNEDTQVQSKDDELEDDKKETILSNTTTSEPMKDDNMQKTEEKADNDKDKADKTSSENGNTMEVDGEESAEKKLLGSNEEVTEEIKDAEEEVIVQKLEVKIGGGLENGKESGENAEEEVPAESGTSEGSFNQIRKSAEGYVNLVAKGVKVGGEA